MQRNNACKKTKTIKPNKKDNYFTLMVFGVG